MSFTKASSTENKEITKFFESFNFCRNNSPGDVKEFYVENRHDLIYGKCTGGSITEAVRSVVTCGPSSDECISTSFWVCNFGKCVISDQSDCCLAEIDRVARY